MQVVLLAIQSQITLRHDARYQDVTDSVYQSLSVLGEGHLYQHYIVLEMAECSHVPTLLEWKTRRCDP